MIIGKKQAVAGNEGTGTIAPQPGRRIENVYTRNGAGAFIFERPGPPVTHCVVSVVLAAWCKGLRQVRKAVRRTGA
jgi:hypothetical protein